MLGLMDRRPTQTTDREATICEIPSRLFRTILYLNQARQANHIPSPHLPPFPWQAQAINGSSTTPLHNGSSHCASWWFLPHKQSESEKKLTSLFQTRRLVVDPNQKSNERMNEWIQSMHSFTEPWSWSLDDTNLSMSSSTQVPNCLAKFLLAWPGLARQTKACTFRPVPSIRSQLRAR